eukprot:GDKI01016067.1.p1 GENE.GDKI01016067.1~~GDKI01016067.1.p1  ORF type:complete len:358 (-),score=97.46 GDKI01016067.1:144-1217(-)
MGYSALQLGVFALMTVQRASHNTLIEFAKEGQQDFPFPAATIAWTAGLLALFFGIACCYIFCDGVSSVKRALSLKGCWHYASVAFWCSASDVFEMEANRYVDSATYTVLGQSKLIVTAILMAALLGKRQTTVQWMVLVVLTLGMCEYVFTAGGAATISWNGVLLALAKVFVSCINAVVMEQKMRQDNSGAPFLVQYTQVRFASVLATAGYFLLRDWQHLCDHSFNVFAGWTWRTYALVLLGFVAKGMITQFLLKVLDSVLKGISEVAALLLVYFNKILFLNGSFKADGFIAALIVTCAVYSYFLTTQQALEGGGEKDGKSKVLTHPEAVSNCIKAVRVDVESQQHTVTGVYVHLPDR